VSWWLRMLLWPVMTVMQGLLLLVFLAACIWSIWEALTGWKG